VPSGIAFRLRSWAEFWEAWAAKLNPRYRQSMLNLRELEARAAECRALLDSLPR
jgi:hypothetical protein